MENNDIKKRLEQDAQRIVERMPTMGAKRPEALKVAKSLSGFIATRQLTQMYVARSLGISPSTLSQFLRGKYKGDVAAIVNKAVNFINSATLKEKHRRETEFVDTAVAKKINTLITHVDAFSKGEGKIGMIIGDGGHGKSFCLRTYAEANKNSVYVELDDAMTPTMLFAEIARALLVDGTGTLSIVTRRIIDILRFRQMIVILDEASGLSVSKLNMLRQIIVVKAKCPLILAGNSDLLKTTQQPTTPRGHESLDQFTSRLMQVLNLDALAADKDGGLYTAEDVRKLYQYGGVRLSTDAVSTLQKIAKTPRSGRLRTCSLVIDVLHTARAVDDMITGEMIISAIMQLDLPQRNRISLAVPPAKEKQAVAKAG